MDRLERTKRVQQSVSNGSTHKSKESLTQSKLVQHVQNAQTVEVVPLKHARHVRHPERLFAHGQELPFARDGEGRQGRGWQCFDFTARHVARVGNRRQKGEPGGVGDGSGEDQLRDSHGKPTLALLWSFFRLVVASHVVS